MDMTFLLCVLLAALTNSALNMNKSTPGCAIVSRAKRKENKEGEGGRKNMRTFAIEDMRHDMTGQGRTGQGRTRQDTTQRNTTQHNNKQKVGVGKRVSIGWKGIY